jgi:acetyl-CoA acetyltransferase
MALFLLENRDFLGFLRPAVDKSGSVTAGNASGMYSGRIE